MDSPRKKTCAPSVAARSLRLTLVRLVAYFITACALVVTYAIYASDLVDAVAVAYSLTSCVSLVFIILYGWRSQWRRTPQGRGLMALTSAFTLVGLCFSLMRVLPNFPGENTMKFLILAVFILTEVHITSVLYRIQTEASDVIRRKEHELYSAIKNVADNTAPAPAVDAISDSEERVPDDRSDRDIRHDSPRS